MHLWLIVCTADRVQLRHNGYRHAEGTLSKAEPSYADLLSIAKPGSTASLLFVINASSGMLAGEAAFDADQLGNLDLRIKSNMLQVQQCLCAGIMICLTVSLML